MQKKHKLLLAGWLLAGGLNFLGSSVEHMTYQWCVKYNRLTPEPIAKVQECAIRSYSSWYYLGRTLQFNPVSHLFYFAASIIDGE
jgi:hypothetical protein